MGTIIIPNLQMRQWRHRGVNSLPEVTLVEQGYPIEPGDSWFSPK